ncbi:alanine dehydrogenase [Spiractinospora alimapuensis]|uniref:alanine dehydrogenase n=1 Tax=Spiractinospora alimapuensis TaxID=2820884 RepID=UPI001EEB2F00|nr:alanine dehydrogenase [Spiractinospora alimapuensis]QVQ53315.1 alanine dehydrogenase [Spiractinospora alimapuensis]
MRVGVPKEVKNHEYRVATTPAGVHELVRDGHEVVVQEGAGAGSSIPDTEYVSAGARVVPDAATVWESSDLVWKVKEPVASEFALMREGQLLFTYLHLAASKECTQALLEHKVTAVAYETVQTADGGLPLLAPMSEIAGRLAPQAGAQTLLSVDGGRGVLMGGVPGVRPAQVTILGAGVAGLNAARVALGMGAEVTLLDVSTPKLRHADELFQGRVRTLASNTYSVESTVLESDLVIGAVLLPGAKAPTLVSNELVSRMRPGSVLVDIAVDQGGCFADTRPTTYDAPSYPVRGSLFYCVANMPGAVPHTSTHALTKDTLPFAHALADRGWRHAMAEDPRLARGLNTHAGVVTNTAVAEAHGLPAMSVAEALTEG